MARPRYRPPVSMPGMQSPAFATWLLGELRRIGESFDLVAQTDVDSVIRQERLDVPAGAVRRVSPSPSGMAVILEAPGSGNAGATVTLHNESPGGPLTVTASPHVGADGKVSLSLINGERQATFSISGVVVLYS